MSSFANSLENANSLGSADTLNVKEIFTHSVDHDSFNFSQANEKLREIARDNYNNAKTDPDDYPDFDPSDDQVDNNMDVHLQEVSNWVVDMTHQFRDDIQANLEAGNIEEASEFAAAYEKIISAYLEGNLEEVVLDSDAFPGSMPRDLREQIQDAIDDYHDKIDEQSPDFQPRVPPDVKEDILEGIQGFRDKLENMKRNDDMSNDAELDNAPMLG